MSRHRVPPPWDYLHDASISSLESYELTRLNHVANIRREMGVLIEQWIEDSAQALLARWILDDRALVRPSARESVPASQSDLPFSNQRTATRALCGTEPSPKYARKARAVGER